MGVKYEVNWFLVTDDLNFINVTSLEIYSIKKLGMRIYPVDANIPLIVKGNSCVGLVNISSFKISKEYTEIDFVVTEVFKRSSIVADHYYSQYVKLKED